MRAWEENRKRSQRREIPGYHIFRAELQIGANAYVVTLKVREHRDGERRYYQHVLTEIEPATSPGDPSPLEAGGNPADASDSMPSKVAGPTDDGKRAGRNGGGARGFPAEATPRALRAEPAPDPIVAAEERELQGPVPASTETTIARNLRGTLGPTLPGQRGAPISAPEVMQAFGRIAGAAGQAWTHRVGRVKAGALGQFSPQTWVTRIREANDLPTAAHELAHALEVFLWGQDNPWTGRRLGVSGRMQRELVALGQALYGRRKPAGGYKREGWAEFVRLWLTTDGEAAKAAPTFADWFERDFLGKNPEIAAAVAEAKQAAERWRKQGSYARGQASVVDPGSLQNKARRALAGLREVFSARRWLERGLPLREASRRAEEQTGSALAIEDDPYRIFGALRKTHDARARYMVERGMINHAGNVKGPALQEIRALVRGRKEEFTLYLWARRALALWNDPKNGPRHPGLSRQDAEQLVRELETPAFQLAAQKVYDWSDGVLNYAAWTSPTLKRAVEAIRATDPGDYIPLQRFFEELDAELGPALRAGGTGSAARGEVSKRLKGSGRRIKDPFPVLIAQASRTIRTAHERAVLDAVVKLSRIEGMGGLIEPVARPPVPAAHATLLDVLERARKAVEEAGGSLEVDPGEGLDLAAETLTFFAPAQRTPAGEPVFAVWEEGRVRWYQLDAQLYDALSGLDVYRLPKLLEWIAGKPLALFRAGTTGLRASFGLVVNPLRDVQTFYMNTQSRRHAPRLLQAWGQEMVHAALNRAGKKSDAIDAFERLGLEMALPLGQDTDPARRAARRLFESRFDRVIDARNWLDFWRDLVQTFEAAPRTAEMILVGERIGWKPGEPMSWAQSLEMMEAAKQVTVDFTAAGSLAEVLNRCIPFFNVAIQAPRAVVRAWKRNPQQVAWRALEIAALSLLLWWQHRDDEWWTELEGWQKFFNWHIPFELNGRRELLRIPMPQEVGVFFAGVPVMLADVWYREDPQAAKDWLGALVQLLPGGFPVLLEEAGEQLANRDTFTGRPIVSKRLESKPAEEQFDENTTRAAVVAGDLFNLSPKRIDHAVRGIAGPVAGDVLELTGLGAPGRERERELSDLPVAGRLFQRGGELGTSPRSIDALYETLEQLKKKQHSDRHPETEEEREIRLQTQDAADAVSAILRLRSLKRSADERRALTHEALTLAREARRDARAGVDRRDEFWERRLDAEATLEEAEEATAAVP